MLTAIKLLLMLAFVVCAAVWLGVSIAKALALPVIIVAAGLLLGVLGHFIPAIGKSLSWRPPEDWIASARPAGERPPAS